MTTNKIFGGFEELCELTPHIDNNDVVKAFQRAREDFMCGDDLVLPPWYSHLECAVAHLAYGGYIWLDSEG